MLICVAIVVVLAGGRSMAADTPGSSDAAPAGLDEIVVTATRREERLQDVPVSVTAFSQAKLDAEGLRNIDDLSRLSPGVTFQRNGSSGNYNDESSDINIRGVESTTGASTTGVYIDDTPIQSRHIGFSLNPYPALFDLDRVEVLRGPQGTLFGAGAEGGVVRFITPDPSATISSGYLRSEVADTEDGAPSYEMGAAAGIPIIADVLGLRVSASYRQDGGYVDRVAYTQDATNPLSPPNYLRTVDANSNYQDTVTVHAALKWVVNDAVTVTPSFYYQHLYLNDTGAYWNNLSNPSAGVFRNGNALPDSSADPFGLAAIKVNWNLGGATLTSNTSYYSRDLHSNSDYSQFNSTLIYSTPYPAPGATAPALFDEKEYDFYQEVRLASADRSSRLDWNVGAFYSHQNENEVEEVYDSSLTSPAAGFCTAAIPCPDGLVFNEPLNRYIDKQLAGFGEVGFKVTDTIKLTAGARYSKVDYTATTFASGALEGPPSFFERSANEHPITPKYVVSWQPQTDSLYYASAAKGFRIGGVNRDLPSSCDADFAALGVSGTPRQYASDHLWSYEIGGKNSFLDRRLQINSSLFYIDWRDIQQAEYLPTCGYSFTANLGKVESRGGEIELQSRPVDPLLIDFSAAYTDAKFAESACAGTLSFNGTACVGSPAGVPVSAAPAASAGDRLPGAKWTFLASAEYTFADVFGRKPYARADYQYATAQTALLPTQDSRNAVYDTTIPGLPLNKNLSLRAGMRWNGFDVSAFVNNLTNAHPLMYSARDVADSSFDILYFDRTVRPRTVGVTATYRY